MRRLGTSKPRTLVRSGRTTNGSTLSKNGMSGPGGITRIVGGTMIRVEVTIIVTNVFPLALCGNRIMSGAL